MSTPQKAGSMPKKGKSTPKKDVTPDAIDFNALVEAVKDCLNEHKGIRPTARTYNVPHVTLKRHVDKVKAAFDDVSSVADTDLLNFVQRSRMHLPSNMVICSTILLTSVVDICCCECFFNN